MWNQSNKRSYVSKTFICLAILLLPGFVIAQQTFYNVLSPERNSVIKPNELFIVLEIPKKDSGRVKSVSIKMNEETDLSGLAKIKGNLITVFYPGILNPHEHQIEVGVKYHDRKGTYYVAYFRFDVLNESKERRQNKRQEIPVEPIKKEIHGRVSVSSRDEMVKGDGAYLRQEPNSTRVVDLSVVPSIGKVSFPIKLRYNNNNTSTLQPRNRFQVGVRTKNQELLYGDHYLFFDKYILNGARVRGVRGAIGLQRNNTLYVVSGNVRNGIEGQLRPFDPTIVPPTPTLTEDSNYVVPGTYQRKLLGIRLQARAKNKLTRVGISFIKSKDQIGSVQHAAAPQENIGIGMDYRVYALKKRLRFDAGVAVSATTNDISTGARTREEIEEIYGVDINFNPKSYERIFTVNASTYPLMKKGLSSLLMHGRLTYKLPKNRFTVGAKKIGGGFNSFGNPFLRNDRFEWYVRDRISFLSRKINLTLGYRYFENDLSDNQRNTKYTSLINTGLQLAPNKKWPRINLGYRLHLRVSSKDVLTSTSGTDNISAAYMSTFYRFATGKYNHNVQLMLNQSKSEYAFSPNSGNEYLYGMFGVSEEFPFGLRADVRVGKTVVRYDLKEADDSYMFYNLGARYTFMKGKAETYARYGNYSSAIAGINLPSVRTAVSLGFRYKIYKGIIGNIEAGIAPYRNEYDATKNYDETYFRIRLDYSY
jgi:hypothetical protein